jgi:hypothetical protein
VRRRIERIGMSVSRPNPPMYPQSKHTARLKVLARPYLPYLSRVALSALLRKDKLREETSVGQAALKVVEGRRMVVRLTLSAFRAVSPRRLCAFEATLCAVAQIETVLAVSSPSPQSVRCRRDDRSSA